MEKVASNAASPAQHPEGVGSWRPWRRRAKRAMPSLNNIGAPRRDAACELALGSPPAHRKIIMEMPGKNSRKQCSLGGQAPRGISVGEQWRRRAKRAMPSLKNPGEGCV